MSEVAKWYFDTSIINYNKKINMIFVKIDFQNKLWHIVLVRLLFETIA